MNFNDLKKVYIVGICGVGTSAMAILFKQMGVAVAGSDTPSSKGTPTRLILEKEKIKVYDSFGKDHITSDIDLVITPALHNGVENIEVLRAIKQKIHCMTYAQCLGELMAFCKTGIAVCGTHGKTTTSAIIASVLRSLHKKSGYIVGTTDFNNGLSGGGYTGNDYFVAEADEYVTDVEHDRTPKFMYTHPDYAIILNIDFDHMDVYKTFNDVIAAYKKYIEQIIHDKKIIIYCSDDTVLTKVIKQYDAKHFVSYGLNNADFKGENIIFRAPYYEFDVSHLNKHLGHFTLEIQGTHNVSNAISTIALFYHLGFDVEKVKLALSQFKTASRRLQKIFEGKVLYYDDYAHHPTEIYHTLKTLRHIHPDKRIIVIFQPHTYSRTQALLDDFIDALKLADKTYLLDIYGSVREKKPDNAISSNQIETIAKKRHIDSIKYIQEEEIYKNVSRELKKNDILLTIGAGDMLFFMREKLINIVKNI